jgi:hypothetical protein
MAVLESGKKESKRLVVNTLINIHLKDFVQRYRYLVAPDKFKGTSRPRKAWDILADAVSAHGQLCAG